ncbi:MAG: aspartate-semialdehyde dehydrogenase [Vampirovibrionia bacterium]
MSNPRIAVLGATGVVGNEILKILAERKFPYKSIKFLASARSAGKTINFNGQDHIIEEATANSFKDVDIVLSSAGSSTSKRFVDDIVKSGAVIVDNTSAFRMDEGIPLVIAGVNDDDLKLHKGVVANPNCSTSQLMLVLKPLHDANKIKRFVISTYQSVSGAGKEAIDELIASSQAAINDEEFTPKALKKKIGFNLIPHIDSFCENGYTKEEMKVTNETRKILHAPDMQISCTAVRVPVVISHSESVNIEFENPMSPATVREILAGSYGVEVWDDPEKDVYPTPIDAAGLDPVYVGRIRADISCKNGIALWVVADNLRIGAALNTVRLAEKLVDMKLLNYQKVTT